MQMDLERPEFSEEFEALKRDYELEQGTRVRKFARRLSRVLFNEGVREFKGEFRQLDDFEVSFRLDFGTVKVSDDDRYDADYLKAHERSEGDD